MEANPHKRREGLLTALLLLGLVWLILLQLEDRHAVRTFGRPHAESCRVVGVDDLPPRNLWVLGDTYMTYPGGLHYRISCPTGVIYHLKVPREQP